MRIANKVILKAIELLLEAYPVMKVSEAAAVVELIVPLLYDAEDVTSTTADWLYNEACDVIEIERCCLVRFAKTLQPDEDTHADRWALEHVLDMVLTR